MAKKKTKGVFCLEDDWWGTMKSPSSVEPILHLLNRWDPYYVPYIHRNTATRGSLEYYLKSGLRRRTLIILSSIWPSMENQVR
jgi:hypothetical protein